MIKMLIHYVTAVDRAIGALIPKKMQLIDFSITG
jgi:hypothetical protein